MNALVGDPARSCILDALMDDRAMTATELAFASGVSPQTTSAHLAKLTSAGILTVIRQGRFRYFRLASPLVGEMLESIIAVAAVHGPSRYQPRTTRDEALRAARTCYDHIAGSLGVQIAEAVTRGGYVYLDADGGEVTPDGLTFFRNFSFELPEPPASRNRVFCRPCLDWTERRFHLAGNVGRTILSRCLEAGWVTRRKDSRALTVTETGVGGFQSVFGITWTTTQLNGK